MSGAWLRPGREDGLADPAQASLVIAITIPATTNRKIIAWTQIQRRGIAANASAGLGAR